MVRIRHACPERRHPPAAVCCRVPRNAMRDPKRIPLILAAVERRWVQDPDLRLGQLLVNLARYLGSECDSLFGLPDGELLRRLGAETEEERRYVENEPVAAREGWRAWAAKRSRPPSP